MKGGPRITRRWVLGTVLALALSACSDRHASRRGVPDDAGPPDAGTEQPDGECQTGATRTCGSGVGECEPGTEMCVDGSWGSCTDQTGPSLEICDALDNDCDALTDEWPACDCPTPPVFCAAPVPNCPRGEYPAVEPEECPLGNCPGRCYTGACLPCGDECRADEDCLLIGRHNCDWGVGSCVEARPATVLDEDPCYYDASLPIPPEPPGCEPDDPLCPFCWHCGPDAVRCEGGWCMSVWTGCEPEGCPCD